MELTNCTALVTGANRGIGAAFVAALLEAGAQKVYAACRNPEAGDLEFDAQDSPRGFGCHGLEVDYRSGCAVSGRTAVGQ
ncbi:MAG: NAD(P)-dependent dehydrogenase (short-subunit alcohol dehydrogenase family) [Glaciecola sp.]|jgi:NAD(P)-dependent dehydrogenase (short-subunit alcohol dehydrogenase family)|uniref:hypothetical protein n=1 Tax=Congregibacter sp. TaxID=2744308 RepID=UPI0039E55E59